MWALGHGPPRPPAGPPSRAPPRRRGGAQSGQRPADQPSTRSCRHRTPSRTAPRATAAGSVARAPSIFVVSPAEVPRDFVMVRDRPLAVHSRGAAAVAAGGGATRLRGLHLGGERHVVLEDIHLAHRQVGEVSQHDAGPAARTSAARHMSESRTRPAASARGHGPSDAWRAPAAGAEAWPRRQRLRRRQRGDNLRWLLKDQRRARPLPAAAIGERERRRGPRWPGQAHIARRVRHHRPLPPTGTWRQRQRQWQLLLKMCFRWLAG